MRLWRKDKPLYATWMSMKQRCYNPKNKKYPSYGGRGVKVCDRWLESYDSFASDMGERPTNHSIDRIDNNGDYTPNNCRWATPVQQGNNQQRSLRTEEVEVIVSLNEQGLSSRKIAKAISRSQTAVINVLRSL